MRHAGLSGFGRVDEGNQVTITGSQLAVLLRQTQWTLDDVAHDLPAGRVTPEAREELATMLEVLVSAIHQSAGVVIDPER